MNRIDIVIATRNRYDKLMRTINSIPHTVILGINIKIAVACDADIASYGLLLDNPMIDRLVLIDRHSGAVYCRNQLIKNSEDAVIYATDDIEFINGGINKAILAMREKFPNDDGVIGFKQTGNHKFCPSGVGLVGKNYLKRYPGKQLFFPDYFHFAAQEIHQAAHKLNKFYLCNEAIVHHHNPFLESSEMDQTHVDARMYKEKDHKLSSDRKAKGLVWGLND